MDSYEFAQKIEEVNGSVSDDEESQVDYTDVIEENHLLLVTHLQLDRYFLFGYLRSKAILDEEDVELVNCTGTTRKHRVSRFLDLIKRKGKIGMLHFVNALQFENPDLYQKLTGKKANATPSPVGNINFAMLHDGKGINDIDHSFLAKQLAQLAQVTEEKTILERKLVKANNDLQSKEEEIELLKMNNTISKMQPGHQAMMETRCSKLLNQQEVKISQQDQYVTLLQGKLLELMEEMEHLRKEAQVLGTKNDVYSMENLELRFNYDSEKRQSVVLKERVKKQEYDKNYVDKFKTDMKQNITDMISLREENIALKKEVEEFRKYGEVLNTRFKFLVQEKNVISEKHKSLSSSNLLAIDEVSILTNANSMLQLEKEHLQRANKRLIDNVSISTELQNSLQNERNKIREECDNLHKSLEEAKHQKDLAEEVAQSHILTNTELCKKYTDVCKELNDLHLTFQQSNEILKNKSDIEKFKDEPTPQIEIVHSNNILEETHLDGTNDKTLEYLDIEGMNHFRKRRSNRQVLDSIKRSAKETDIEKISTLQTSLSFEQISWLHPSSNLFRPRNGTEISDSSSNEGKDLLDNVFTQELNNCVGNNNDHGYFLPRSTHYDHSKGKPCNRQASMD